VTPVLLKPGSTPAKSARAICVGKNVVAFRAGWKSLIFSRQAKMPHGLDSE
jgi:hypothetical protein